MDNNFYQNLWKLLDRQRGSMDLHKFKEICFDLIFLLAINRQFEQQKAKISANHQEDSDYYELWLEKESRWETILANCQRNNLNQTIYEALKKIEQTDKNYENLTHKETFLNQNLDFQKLSTIVNDFNNFFAKLDPQLQIDYLGNTYQFFLQWFAASSGRTGGEFYTPAQLVQLLVNILQPFPQKDYEVVIYDPCCGSGGMFIQSQEFINKNKKGNNVYPPLCLGQEIDDSTWKLARMNLLLNGLNPQLGNRAEDTFKEDLHPNKQTDYIITNPPFNISDYYWKEDDPRWVAYGVPPKNDANFAWIEHCLFKLKEKGVAAIIMANGTLSGLNKKAANIRKNLIENDVVDAIITLPNKLFYSTSIAPCVWIFRKGKKENGILMIDISSDEFGEKVSNNERRLTEKEIKNVSQIYQDFRQKGFIEKSNIPARVVLPNEIRENNYILVPARYLASNQKDLTPEEIDQKLLKTTQELEDLITEQDKYHQELKKLLAEIKKEIESDE